MGTPETREEAAVVAAFLGRYLADRAEGRKGTLAEYQALFPEHAATIAREFEALADAPSDGTFFEGRPPGDAGSGGDLVGPYRLRRLLGRGGQGEVWLAHDERLRRSVALKLLRSLGPIPAPAMERFRREAEIASRLDHPGICAVYDAGTEGGLAWIAMRFVEGESLAASIERRRGGRNVNHGRPGTASGSATQADTVPDRDAATGVVFFFEEAARAVQVAHGAGVIHRDLKPANLMIAPGGRPVVLDFGLARDLVNEMATLTATGETFGTPAYMSPEQISGASRMPDPRTDVWALGVSLYEALTLRRPFEGATREALYRSIMESEPARPRSLCPSLPRDLEVVVLTAIEKDLDRRYQTAGDLAEDLRRVRELESILARPAGPAARAWRWARRRPAAATALVLAFTLVAVGTFIAFRWSDLEAQEARRREDALEREIEEGYFALAGTSQAAEAAGAFGRALAIDPASAEAHAGFALALVEAGSFAEALAHLDAAPPGIAGHPALQAARAEAARAGARAEDAAEPLPGGPPADPTALLIAAMREIRFAFDGNPQAFARAADLLQRCMLRAPRARRVHYVLLALATSNLKDASAARRIAGALGLLWPDSARAAWAAGTALILHEPKAAEAHFERALRLRPGYPVYLTCRGQARREAGDPMAAAADHRAAIAASPGFAPAWRNLGVALRDLGDLPGAAEAFTSATRLSPHDAAAAINLGDTLRLQGEPARAAEILEGVVGKVPENATAWAGLGFAHAAARNAAGAVRALEEAVKRDPLTAHDLALSVGALQLELGDTPAAATTFGDLVRKSPESAQGWSNLAVALEKSGDLEEALRASRRAAGLAPENADIQITLSFILRESGEFEEAVGALRRAQEIESRHAGMSRPIHQWIAEAERLVAEARQVDRFVLRGELSPEGLDALGPLARTAMLQRRFATAARLAEMGLERAPSAPAAAGAENLHLQLIAARAAVRASFGEGRDAAGIPATEREDWRNKARLWLMAELDRLRRVGAAGTPDSSGVKATLSAWLLDPAFEGVRGPKRLDGLTLPEADRWRSFWKEVEAFRSKLNE